MQIRNLHKNGISCIFGYYPSVIAKTLLASLFIIAHSAQAQSNNNADIFYIKAVKLERLGIRAPLDPNFKSVISQAKRSFKITETRNNVAAKKGAPLYCRKKDQNMSPRELLAQMRKIPKIKRQRMSLTQAFLIIAKRKYPCR